MDVLFIYQCFTWECFSFQWTHMPIRLGLLDSLSTDSTRVVCRPQIWLESNELIRWKQLLVTNWHFLLLPKPSAVPAERTDAAVIKQQWLYCKNCLQSIHKVEFNCYSFWEQIACIYLSKWSLSAFYLWCSSIPDSETGEDVRYGTICDCWSSY